MSSPHDGQDLSSERRQAGVVSDVVACRLLSGLPLPPRLHFKLGRPGQRNKESMFQNNRNQEPDSPARKHAACLTLLAPHSHISGQTTQIIDSLSPKRDWGPKLLASDCLVVWSHMKTPTHSSGVPPTTCSRPPEKTARCCMDEGMPPTRTPGALRGCSFCCCQ